MSLLFFGRAFIPLIIAECDEHCPDDGIYGLGWVDGYTLLSGS